MGLPFTPEEQWTLPSTSLSLTWGILTSVLVLRTGAAVKIPLQGSLLQVLEVITSSPQTAAGQSIPVSCIQRQQTARMFLDYNPRWAPDDVLAGVALTLPLQPRTEGRSHPRSR